MFVKILCLIHNFYWSIFDHSLQILIQFSQYEVLYPAILAIPGDIGLTTDVYFLVPMRVLLLQIDKFDRLITCIQDVQ